jgi:prolyl 4-hydroxylase
MAGALIRRDLGEARRLYGLAAGLGIAEAAPVHEAMLANGAGGSRRHWAEALTLLAARGTADPAAARGAALLAAMKIDAEGDPLDSPAREVVHHAPRLERLPGFLTADECRYLAELARPHLAPAVVVDPRSGRFIQDPVRNAETAGFPFVLEDPVLHAINRRIAHATATTYEQGEPSQVLSYKPGQEYKLHSDSLPPGNNQRIATFLVTLSDGFTGGATSFPRLGLELTGQLGDGLFFVNTDAAGQPDAAMWHAGLPVSSGRKLLLSKWIRGKPLDLAGPPGRPF